MSIRRREQLLALALIGDGLFALLKPSREAHAWKVGPEPWRSMMAIMAQNPRLTRAVGAAQVGVGVWWIMRKDKPPKSIIQA